jgi:hypothetical protein
VLPTDPPPFLESQHLLEYGELPLDGGLELTFLPDR